MAQTRDEDEAEDEAEALQLKFLAGLALLGKRVRFAHMAPGSGSRCMVLHSNGLVEIEALSGQFAPHLFVVDEGG